MGRRAATALHVALSVVGAVLYFVFVLPRWWVLTGDIPPTLATVGRIAAGVPIAMAPLPVLATLQHALRPGFRTPELALRLRAWSALLHVVAGVLILLAAIAEIWLSLDIGGPYLFAVYGAAAAIAILAILAFALSFVAEKPPAATKPAKPARSAKIRMAEAAKRRRAAKGAAPTAEASNGDETAATAATAATDETAETAAVVEVTGQTAAAVEQTVEVEATTVSAVETNAVEAVEIEAETPEVEPPAAGGLRNQRPAGKSRHRLPR